MSFFFSFFFFLSLRKGEDENREKSKQYEGEIKSVNECFGANYGEESV